jgi:hypothetical protein
MAANVSDVHEAPEPAAGRRRGFRARPNLHLSRPARQAARSAALREMLLLDAVAFAGCLAACWVDSYCVPLVR